MTLRSHRRAILGLGLVAYLCGLAIALRTGIPSALSVSILLIASMAWGYGQIAGSLIMVGCFIVEFSILSVILPVSNPIGIHPMALLIPVMGTQIIVLISLSALYRADHRQLIVTTELRERNAALAEALAEVKELRGMLPICAWCKSIREVNGLWDKLEAYLAKHARVTLTHSICPTCITRLEADFQGKAG